MRRVEVGEDPSADKRRVRADRAAAMTVREAADQFVERYAKPRNRSWRETARILEVNVCSEWGDLALMDIGRGGVVLLMDKLADRTPVMANRTLATLRRMMPWHVERGTIPASPAEGTRERKG